MARPKGSFSKPHDFADFVGELRLSQRFIWSKSVARFLEAVSATSIARLATYAQERETSHICHAPGDADTVVLYRHT